MSTERRISGNPEDSTDQYPHTMKDKDDIKGKPALAEAYRLGISICYCERAKQVR